MKSAWTWWRIGSALFVLTLIAAVPAFVRLAIYDIPGMIRGDMAVITLTTEKTMQLLLWPASMLCLVVFLLSELVKDDSQTVEWRHVVGVVTTVAVFALVIQLSKLIPTNFPVLAVAVPATIHLRLRLNHPRFRTRSMMTMWRIPQKEAPGGPKHDLSREDETINT